MVPEFLKDVSLFQDLDQLALAQLATLLVSKKISAGAVIFRESDDSDALYVVETGQSIISKHVQGEVDIVLTRFHHGDFFGDMGLFDAAQPSATAHAETTSILWRLCPNALAHI